MKPQKPSRVSGSAKKKRTFGAGAFGIAALCGGLIGAAGIATSFAQTPAPADATSTPAATPAPAAVSPQDALIARGKYLTDAADCYVCHTQPGHAPFTGGLAFNTAFGTLYSTNLTPDKESGIGNWSDEDFWNAMHYGTGRGRSFLVFPKFLYPAMTFTSYTKMTRQDVLAIKAYLDSLAPVQTPEIHNHMNFPFSMRPVLLGWRIMFFRAGEMKYDPSWNQNVRNGAYLTEALGHCGECHTPRNALGAMIESKSLAGSPIDAFYASNISSDKKYGVGGWSSQELATYLYKGSVAGKGSAYGPMEPIVKYSLSQLTPSDIADMSLYLQTATAPRADETVIKPISPADQALGQKTYATYCAACHKADGTGIYPIIPNLAGNDSVGGAGPENVIGAVLSELGATGGPPMPSFAKTLSNAQISAVTNYVRSAWGNGASANATPDQVEALRSIAAAP